MRSLAVNGYAAQDVLDVLEYRRGDRTVDFRYDLLDKTNTYLGVFPGMRGGAIRHSAFSEIKRSASFEAQHRSEVNYLSDRIKPWFRLQMPDGGWAEWPLGVFLLSSPTMRRHTEGTRLRSLEAYDQGVAVSSKFTSDRRVFAAGTVVTTKIRDLLIECGIPSAFISIVASDKTLPSAMEFKPGVSLLSIVNALLGAINYLGLWFDNEGQAVCRPYSSPAAQLPEAKYHDNHRSVMFDQVEKTLDLFDVPNEFIVVVSDPDQGELRSVYTNKNPDSPTSTVSRGFTISDYREQQQAVDQATLDGIAARLAFEASQVYERINIESATMPHHEHLDVIDLGYKDIEVLDKVQEVYWQMGLKPGGRMQHTLRKVISV